MQSVRGFILWECILVYFCNVCLCYVDNLSCRDNEGASVDWWYLYKPPSEDLEPLNKRYEYKYFYITSKEADKRWVPGYDDLDTSMLTKTLAPLYKISNVKNLAVVTYSQRSGISVTSDIGVLIADGQGGVYMGHTLPGYPDLDAESPTFPPEELVNGHMFACLSLTLVSINKLAEVVNAVNPRFLHTRIPAYIGQLLPDWNFKRHKAPTTVPVHALQYLPEWNLDNEKLWDSTHPLYYTINTKAGNKAVLLYKRQKLSHDYSLYRQFALSHKVVLDVYGQSEEPLTTECTSSYSVRNIEKVSIKQPEDQTVIYVDKSNDYARFAVTTGAHWQQNGSSSPTFWTCTSSLDKEDKSGISGLMVCIDNYEIWNSFDNLKAYEPTCY